MDKTDNYILNVDYKAISHAEKYIESLFRQWSINEIYLGNIVTSFSNLIHLLLEHQRDGEIDITAQLKNEEFSFKFAGVAVPILKLFLKEHLLQDVLDNTTQSVFLIQKVADEISVEGENLILKFNIGALPEAFLNNRKQSLENYHQNTPQKTLND
ncbi:MAG TPA: hypothetical protein ENG85_03530 [Bacteroidetes bacterium]|nr:hypothetical protein [Bacteroidota bacterium]